MKPKTMKNTRTGKVVVYDKTLIAEMPWYEPIIDEAQSEPVAALPEVQPIEIEGAKKVHWKTARKAYLQSMENSA